MEPLGKQIGVAGVAQRRRRPRAARASHSSEEPRRDVRRVRRFDLRHLVEKPAPAANAVGRTDQVHHALAEPPYRLAKQPALGGAHLGRRALDHQHRLVPRPAQQAMAGRIAGDDFDLRGSAARTDTEARPKRSPYVNKTAVGRRFGARPPF